MRFRTRTGMNDMKTSRNAQMSEVPIEKSEQIEQATHVLHLPKTMP